MDEIFQLFHFKLLAIGPACIDVIVESNVKLRGSLVGVFLADDSVDHPSNELVFLVQLCSFTILCTFQFGDELLESQLAEVFGQVPLKNLLPLLLNELLQLLLAFADLGCVLVEVRAVLVVDLSLGFDDVWQYQSELELEVLQDLLTLFGE